MAVEVFELDGGKYEVHRDDETYETKVFRHGEPWVYDLVGNKFIHAMLDKIADLECDLNLVTANYELLKFQNATKGESP